MKLKKVTQAPVLAKGDAGEIGRNCGTTGYNTTTDTTIGGNKNGIGVGTQIDANSCASAGYDPRNGGVGATYQCSC
jgi:hypothetical protein